MCSACSASNTRTSAQLTSRPSRAQLSDAHAAVDASAHPNAPTSPGHILARYAPISGVSFSQGSTAHRELCARVALGELTVTTLGEGSTFCDGLRDATPTRGRFRIVAAGENVVRIVRLGPGWSGQRAANFRGDGRDGLFAIRQTTVARGHRYEGFEFGSDHAERFDIHDLPSTLNTVLDSIVSGFDYNDDGYGDAAVSYRLHSVSRGFMRVYLGSATGLSAQRMVEVRFAPDSYQNRYLGGQNGGGAGRLSVLQFRRGEHSELFVFRAQRDLLERDTIADTLYYYSRNDSRLMSFALQSTHRGEVLLPDVMTIQIHEQDRTVAIATVNSTTQQGRVLELAVNSSESFVAVGELPFQHTPLSWLQRLSRIYDGGGWTFALRTRLLSGQRMLEIASQTDPRQWTPNPDRLLSVGLAHDLLQLHPRGTSADSMQIWIEQIDTSPQLPSRPAALPNICDAFAVLHGVRLDSLRCVGDGATQAGYPIRGGGAFASDADEPAFVAMYSSTSGQQIRSGFVYWSNFRDPPPEPQKYFEATTDVSPTVRFSRSESAPAE